jgi:hypothetical protein
MDSPLGGCLVKLQPAVVMPAVLNLAEPESADGEGKS